MWPLLQILRPVASLFFYRSYVKKDVAKHYRRKHPSLTDEESMILAEMDIQGNKVPALDPLGAFREPYETAKTDPVRGFFDAIRTLIFGFLFIGLGFLMFFLILAFLFYMGVMILGRP